MAKTTYGTSRGLVTCQPVELPKEVQHRAAIEAIKRNPANYAPVHNLNELVPDLGQTHAEFITALAGKLWGQQGVMLTVSFLDNPETELRTRILSHMNAWAEF